MTSSPLQIGLQIQQPSGTPRVNIQVLCTNETTTQNTTKNTASDGKVIFNLGSTVDFSKGWNVGDVVSISSIYLGFEQSFSFTIPATGIAITIKDASDVTVGSFRGGFGMSDGILVLITKPAAPSLHLFTPTEWLDYYNMKSKDVDAANGISVLQLTRVGQMVEAGIESDTNTRFDNNSGSYYSPSDFDDGESPEYHDARHANLGAYYLKFPPIVSLTTFEISTNAEGTQLNWKDLVFDQIDTMDSTTGWNATTDGSVTLNTTPSSISEGSGALNLIKSGSTVAAVTYSKTVTSFKFTDRTLSVDYYIEDNTDLTSSDAVEVRFGSSSSAYYSQTWDRSQINSAAYTTLSFQWNDSDVTTTGSPDKDNLTYFAIVVTTVASSTTISAGDQRLDDLRLNYRDRINLDKVTGRVRITNPTDYAEQGSRHIRAIYTMGRASVPQDIKQLAIIETGTHILGSAMVRARISDKSDAEVGDLTFFQNFRTRVIRKYKNQSFLPT